MSYIQLIVLIPELILSPSQTEDMTLRTTNIFGNGIRFLQRTLLGFDEDDPHIALAARFPWPSVLLPRFRNLFMEPRNRCYVNYLPVELLREVFIYLLPDQDWRLQDTPPPQLLLVQICSYWRNVALTYPRLWSTFMIVSPIKRHIPMTKLWLERSGQCPLTIYIDHHNSIRLETLTTTDTVIDLLRPHVSRWKTAIFILDSCVQSSLFALPHEFPLLERFCFDVVGRFRCWSSEDIERVREIFIPSSFLRLREVTWKTFSSSLHIPLLVPTNLIYLSGDFVIDGPFLNALSGLKHLQTLRLHHCPPIPRDYPRLDHHVVLHRLHDLDLLLGWYTPSFLFNSISAPNLRVLVIRLPFREEGRTALYAFIRRSRCKLRAFSYIDDVGYNPEAQFFQELLVSPQMGFLSELNIVIRSSDAVLRLLSRVNIAVLPSLGRFCLSADHCSADVLLDMLKHRANDFHTPTDTLIPETLLSEENVFAPSLRFIPVSGSSLCIKVPVNGHFYEIEAVREWFKCDDRTHWSLVL
ncbi:hypothetical protein J3R30DRAFT_3423901, partial [Lentinula aciculospora]